MAHQDEGLKATLSERQSLASKQSGSPCAADIVESGRSSPFIEKSGSRPKDPRQWSSRAWQAKDVAVVLPILGALLLFGLLGFLSMGIASSSTSKVPDFVVSEDLRRAEVVYQENLRLREAMLTTRGGNAWLRKWRTERPGQMVVDLWFCPPYPCPDELRIGEWGEGGKWVCRSQWQPNPNPIVISVGSQGEYSFEQEMARRLFAFSHTFDFTLDAEQQQTMHGLSFLKFHDAGISGMGEVEMTKERFKPQFPDAKILNLQEMMQRVNRERVDVLKLDCELCEYAVVSDMVALYTRDTVPFGQILVEIHEVMDKTAPQAIEFVKSLESLGYRMFHCEANPYYSTGYELAFIHESLVKPV